MEVDESVSDQEKLILEEIDGLLFSYLDRPDIQEKYAVVIAPQMNWVSPADIEETRLAFRIAIDQWQQSVRDGDLLAYLSLYSDEFQHHGMDKTEWSEYRLQVFESRQITRCEIQDLLLIADPAEEDLYLSRFSQLSETDAGITTTVKRLYWRRLPESRWQIVSEGSG